MKLRMTVLVALVLTAWPLAGRADDKTFKDLAYGPSDANKLDLYLPEKADAPTPLIVWVHGGGWQQGDKKGGPALPFVAKGYAVASINYRLSKEATYPAQIEDCKAAVRYLRANAKKYNLDPDRFGAWGGSAGGHLVALLGTAGDVKELEGKGDNLDVSSRVQAVCDWFGPTDLAQMGGSHDKPDSPEAKLIGGPLQDNKDKVAKANPIIYVTKTAAPFLIMHGDQDKTVPPSQSDLLNEALKKAGVETSYEVVKGAGHGGEKFNTPESLKLVEDFFDKHLKKTK
jgi:acetyl esterase/lipase